MRGNMFYRRQGGYFYRLSKSFTFLRHFDIYDPQSFIREDILDNIFICMIAYCLYYIGLWYADKIIKQIEKVNEEMFKVMQDNKPKLDDLITLKKKRLDYEDVVIKNKGVQRETEKYLENECEKLTADITTTEKNIIELENFFAKCKFTGNTIFDTSEILPISCADGEFIEGADQTIEKPEENIKILEPSFPPPLPPEPPPRKYGIFVARPPGHRVTPGSGPPPAPPVPKIGFKLSSLG